MHHRYILTLICPDRRGIVHRVTGLLLDAGGNILDAQQFGDAQTHRFFLRVYFDVSESEQSLHDRLAALGNEMGFDWQLHDAARRARLLVLVSREGHCLNDLLYRTYSGQLPADIVGVVGNHDDHASLSQKYDVPFHHLPVDADNRAEQEGRILELIRREHVDLVVLARYMQILSPSLCDALAGRAINIHHSFLPGFKGSKPYHQAHERGVKIIGATAHYVTRDLDEGPIIHQDVAHVNHTMTPADLKRIGSDIESIVLAHAVRSHIEHRILLNGHRTVVFE